VKPTLDVKEVIHGEGGPLDEVATPHHVGCLARDAADRSRSEVARMKPRVQEGGSRMQFRKIAYKLAWLGVLAVAIGASWRG
jgi:hypothetical protein